MEKRVFWGLDCGTNSVGVAATDENYNPIRYHGNNLWVSHVFEEAKLCDERRGFRTARRRLNRKKQRVLLTQMIFAEEITKVDPDFYLRLQESALYAEDSTLSECNSLFHDQDYTDKDYHKQYPTIHHLIADLIEDPTPKDVRLVYLAVSWLMAHRGHFLSEVSEDHVNEVLDFDNLYQDFVNVLSSYLVETDTAWDCDSHTIQEILLMKIGVAQKEKMFRDALFDGKKPKTSEEDLVSMEMIMKLLSGGTVDCDKLFPSRTFEEPVKISFRKSLEELEEAFAKLDDDQELLVKMHALFDWALLKEALGDSKYISQEKIRVYEQHKEDLAFLKRFIKKYIPTQFDEVFRKDSPTNYVAYSYHLKNGQEIKKKVKKEEFCDYLKKIVKDISVEECDQSGYQDMLNRLEIYTFLPKQVDGDNRVIPYQVYFQELKMILQNASRYLPFLQKVDTDGISGEEKLYSIFKFRVPYFVGPLNAEHSKYAWMQRRAEGKIYPWNFAEKVDLDQSEQEFIRKMINHCTYLIGEDVLPKNSLLYSKFEVLNEINNLKINGQSISVECKQNIYGLFQNNRKVTLKRIRDYLLANNEMTKEDSLSGIDETIKSSLKGYHDFKRMLTDGILSEADVETIIYQMTFTEDKKRKLHWLKKQYPHLNEEDVKYIAKLKIKDFGRLSKEFLINMKAASVETGEQFTVMQALWETNDNLMQILSSRYTFKEEVEAYQNQYFEGNQMSLADRMDDMYLSNSVKRIIFRTLDILKDFEKVTGAPDRIFIEMAREHEKNAKRTKSRREQILELYKNFSKEEIRELSLQLEGKTDHELQSEVLFLYFMQMGRCMYSGETIDISQLKTDKYNVDHIYPQSKVTDDSISNKVLVKSTLNGAKSDQYPIENAIRMKMGDYWKHLFEKRLISEEKYKRLTRSTPFTQDEKWGFINRQLVETRQSTKALTAILKLLYPKSEIVFVKAGMVSDFRKEYGMVKSRQVNDLHHAKDAYLNIVVGNVYHCKFTKKWFSVDQEYSLNLKTIFKNRVVVQQEVVWEGGESVEKVKRILSKNAVNYTRFAFERKGGLFDQMPVKKAAGLIERKAGLDTAKYGGYNKSTASFFILVRFMEGSKKKKPEVMIVSVDLMYQNLVKESEEKAICYLRQTIAEILGKSVDEITEVTLPLGLRRIKVNTLFSFDGFKACITGKSSGARQILYSSMMPLILKNNLEQYVKYLENYERKLAQYPDLKIQEPFDHITLEKNLELYHFFMEKLSTKPYQIIWGQVGITLEQGATKFLHLSIEEQAICLLRILSVFKTGRAGGCDLTSIGGSKNSAIFVQSAKLSNYRKNYKDFRIIDRSPSGIYESVSDNLLDLL